MEINSLAGTDFETLFTGFEKAFATYDVQINKQQFRAMLQRRGFDPKLSFAAFDNNEIVSFTLNGIGTYNNIPTAYDTGTGTRKEYRGQGLATRIFEYSIPWLKENGIQQYLLEVLQHNTKAVSVYSNLGFETTREFNFFVQKNEEINNPVKSQDIPYAIEQIDIEKFSSIPTFWDFYPSWQNSFDSIRRAAKGFISLGVFSGKQLVGYCVFEPVSGDITQLAVDKPYRRKGIASLLLAEMVRLNKYETIKCINTDINSTSITEFLQTKNVTITGKQFEMVRKL